MCGAWVCVCVCVCIHRSSYNVAGCELVCLVLKSEHSDLGVDFIRLILSSGAQAANLWNCWNPTARSRPRTGEYWLFGLFTPLDKPVFCFSFSLFKCFFFFFPLCASSGSGPKVKWSKLSKKGFEIQSISDCWQALQQCLFFLFISFFHYYHYVLSSCGFHTALSVRSDYLKFQLASIVMAVAVRADWCVIYTVPILRSDCVRSSLFHPACAPSRMSFGIIN